jgi:hypothetical protein
VKKLLFVCAIGLAALTSASADEPRGSLGLRRMHGWNAGASQSGCGSSWRYADIVDGFVPIVALNIRHVSSE